MRYFSMFSGIGGFEYGINSAIKRDTPTRVSNGEADCSPPEIGDEIGRHRTSGVDTEAPRLAPRQSPASDLSRNGSDPAERNGGHGATCVGFSEIDKYASAIYHYHYPEHKNYGDAFKIDPATIPDFDLLVGGFPCQAFSIAGKRKGFEDTRGTLFFEIARILRAKRPRFFVLENVKGLLSHDKGRTFRTIIGTLAELGYGIEWCVLNSKNLGVPQNRERVFIVGDLTGERAGEIFSVAENDGEDIEVCGGERESAQTVNATYARNQSDGQYVIKATQKLSDAQRIRSTGGVSSTLKGLGGGMGAKTGLYAV